MEKWCNVCVCVFLIYYIFDSHFTNVFRVGHWYVLNKGCISKRKRIFKQFDKKTFYIAECQITLIKYSLLRNVLTETCFYCINKYYTNQGRTYREFMKLVVVIAANSLVWLRPTSEYCIIHICYHTHTQIMIQFSSIQNIPMKETTCVNLFYYQVM